MVCTVPYTTQQEGMESRHTDESCRHLLGCKMVFVVVAVVHAVVVQLGHMQA